MTECEGVLRFVKAQVKELVGKKKSKPSRAKKAVSKAKRGLSAKAKAAVERRVPTQERSRKRFDKIVAVAAETFAEQGFDAAKMEAIAAEAGTSIGSVYQFFANKRALFGAVAERCLDRAREAFASRLSADAIGRPWRELLEEMVDTFAVLHRQDPAFRAVMANIALYDDYAEADEALIAEFTNTTAGILGIWSPTLEIDRRHVMASVLVNTIGGLMITGGRSEQIPFEAVLVELKLMLVRYLEPELARAANHA